MLKLLKIILFFVLIFITFVPFSRSISASVLSASPITIKILHTNDIHGGPNDIGAEVFGRIAAYVSSVREEMGRENVLLLDSGDITAGYRCETEDAFIVDEIFKYTGYNAISPGNHEWDCGKQFFVAREKNFGSVAILAANITRKDKTGACTWEPYFKAYQIYSMGPLDNPVKVAVLGLSRGLRVDSYPDTCSQNPIDALTHFYDEAKSEGAEVFILAVHEGSHTATPLPLGMGGGVLLKAMTEAGRPIQLILGGHTHHLTNEKIGETVLAQSGNYGENIGIATLVINRADQGVKVKVSWKNKQFVKADPQDPGVAELINSYSWSDPFEFHHIQP